MIEGMTPVITLAAMVLVPVAVLVFLRVNAVLVFLSLCLGSVLLQFVGSDAADFLSTHADQVPEQAGAANNETIQLVLLLLPAILTAIFMVRTVHGHTKRLLNALPAIGTGLLAALLAVPLLPPDLSAQVTDASLWTQLTEAQDLIVGASAAACLLVLWLSRPKTGGHEKLGKHKG